MSASTSDQQIVLRNPGREVQTALEFSLHPGQSLLLQWLYDAVHHGKRNVGWVR